MDEGLMVAEVSREARHFADAEASVSGGYFSSAVIRQKGHIQRTVPN
jgi:hypothetical protein